MLQLYILSYKLINQTVYIFPLHFLKYAVTHSVKYFKSAIKAVFDKKTGFFFCILDISSFIAIINNAVKKTVIETPSSLLRFNTA